MVGVPRFSTAWWISLTASVSRFNGSITRPYHSKYNPIERCWGILEKHWNGTQLRDVETMVTWAKSMTWRGLHPVIEVSHQLYQKGVSLSKAAMRQVEARLKRHPDLPLWDILIEPVCSV